MNRKSFAIAALSILASATIASCTADQDIENTLSNATADSDLISFRVDNASAAARTTRDVSTTVTDFKVSALDRGHAYFTSPLNVFSTDNGTSWTTATRASWPASDLGLTFVAFVDSSDSFRLDGGEATFADYCADGTSDLMYAVASDARRESSKSGVSLRFRHALSQISFTAQNNHPAYADIEILSVELGGVKGIGTYTFPDVSTSSSSRGEWTLSEASSRSYRLEGLNVSLGACGSSMHGTKTALGSSTRTDDAGVMYLLPQTAEEGAYIKVKARMTLSGTDGASYETEEVIPVSVDWKEGQRYSYNIAWNATPITFDVKVADFREVSATAE